MPVQLRLLYLRRTPRTTHRNRRPKTAMSAANILHVRAMEMFIFGLFDAKTRKQPTLLIAMLHEFIYPCAAARRHGSSRFLRICQDPEISAHRLPCSLRHGHCVTTHPQDGPLHKAQGDYSNRSCGGNSKWFYVKTSDLALCRHFRRLQRVPVDARSALGVDDLHGIGGHLDQTRTLRFATRDGAGACRGGACAAKRVGKTTVDAASTTEFTCGQPYFCVLDDNAVRDIALRADCPCDEALT